MPCFGGVGNQVRIVLELCAPVPVRTPSGLVLNAMPSPLDAQSFVEKPLQESIEAFAKVPIRHMGVFTHGRHLFQTCGLCTRGEVPMEVGPMIVSSGECKTTLWLPLLD